MPETAKLSDKHQHHSGTPSGALSLCVNMLGGLGPPQGLTEAKKPCLWHSWIHYCISGTLLYTFPSSTVEPDGALSTRHMCRPSGAQILPLPPPPLPLYPSRPSFGQMSAESLPPQCLPLVSPPSPPPLLRSFCKCQRRDPPGSMSPQLPL